MFFVVVFFHIKNITAINSLVTASENASEYAKQKMSRSRHERTRSRHNMTRSR